MPNVTPLSVLLFVQAVLLALTQLQSTSPQVSQIIAIVLIVVNAALAVFFQTSPGKTTFARMTIKK
jgi:hypothetical protein